MRKQLNQTENYFIMTSLVLERWKRGSVSPSPDRILIVGGAGAGDSVEECVVV